MSKCIEPNNCPDEATGMPCNSCWSSQQIDQLATLVRETLAAQATSSFQAGRAYGQDGVTALEADAASDAAAAKTVELWQLFYAVAGRYGDQLDELEKMRGTLARITVATARVGIELERAEQA